MVSALLVATIGLLGVIGAALIARLGNVQRSVNGNLSRLLDGIEERDRIIRELMGSDDTRDS